MKDKLQISLFKRRVPLRARSVYGRSPIPPKSDRHDEGNTGFDVGEFRVCGRPEYVQKTCTCNYWLFHDDRWMRLYLRREQHPTGPHVSPAKVSERVSEQLIFVTITRILSTRTCYRTCHNENERCQSTPTVVTEQSLAVENQTGVSKTYRIFSPNHGQGKTYRKSTNCR